MLSTPAHGTSAVNERMNEKENVLLPSCSIFNSKEFITLTSVLTGSAGTYLTLKTPSSMSNSLSDLTH